MKRRVMWLVLLWALWPSTIVLARNMPVYIPTAGIRLEVLGPDGQPRVYPSDKGITRWQPGLPIFKGDRLRVSLLAATGDRAWKRTWVKLDGRFIYDSDWPEYRKMFRSQRDRPKSQPEDAAVPSVDGSILEIRTDRLQTGYHLLEQMIFTSIRSNSATLEFHLDEAPVSFIDPREEARAREEALRRPIGQSSHSSSGQAPEISKGDLRIVFPGGRIETWDSSMPEGTSRIFPGRDKPPAPAGALVFRNVNVRLRVRVRWIHPVTLQPLSGWTKYTVQPGQNTITIGRRMDS